MRFVRPLVVGFFVLVMVVTPLSAFTSGGSFEVWISAVGRAPIRVTLQDHTGLVRGIGPAAYDSRTDDPRTLILPLRTGCGAFWISLDFLKSGNGYELRQHDDRFGCHHLDLQGHGTLGVAFWAPVDASSVEFESD